MRSCVPSFAANRSGRFAWIRGGQDLVGSRWLTGRRSAWAFGWVSRLLRSRAGWARRIHGVAGGGRQRWPKRLPGLAGSPAGPNAGASAQAVQAVRCQVGSTSHGWLREWWSPQQISHRLRIEFPDDPMMRVSHETIYQSLFVQGRGELRRELVRCLRTGRVKRRSRRVGENTGQLRDMVMISERPAEADDRAVPGHWEGDLLMGTDNRTAVGTLVERASRYLLLLHLHGKRDAPTVRDAMQQAITTQPTELARTITWDQGKEMAQHAQFTIATGIPVYFCDPHKPWQRGSNEKPTACSASTYPKAPTCPSTPPTTSPASPTASTADPARPSAT
jgi:Integrase core domain